MYISYLLLFIQFLHLNIFQNLRFCNGFTTSHTIISSKSINSISNNKILYKSIFTKLYAQNKSNLDLMKINSTNLSFSKTRDLESLIGEMSQEDKYNFLIQSYSTQLIDNGSIKPMNYSLLDTIGSLFNEMVINNYTPNIKSSQYLIDSAALSCDCIRISFAIQLSKAAGIIKAFGSCIGLLSQSPMQSTGSYDTNTAFKFPIPIDNREKEVFYAGIITGGILFWSLLGFVSFFDEDIKLWSNLAGALLIFATIYDLISRKAEGILLGIAGFDRLLLRDTERQSHIDASAFTIGYLLGLPCFCFQSSLVEAVKLLRSSDSSSVDKNLIVYKQNINKQQMFKLNDEFKLKDSGNIVDEKNLAFSRVLIWLMTPVTAEMLKYGKCVLSDPRK